MEITIIGAGNGGSAMAADLKIKGHHVSLLKTSSKGDLRHFTTIRSNNNTITLEEKNQSSSVQLDVVTTDISEALTPLTEVVIIFIPTTFHQDIIRRIVPFLRKKQIIMLQPGYLGTAFFLKYAHHLDLTIVEAESSPLDCRITKPGLVTVSFRNVCNPIGVYPVSNGPLVLEKLESFGYNFKLLKSVVESALHNPNLIVHTIGGIMSIPRIDYSNGEYWMYKEVFSPRVWNLVEQLDSEKMLVLEKLGFEPLSYLEACKIRNSPADSSESAKSIFDHYAQFDSIKGPLVSNSRYITEDVPQGLVLLESLGAYLGVETPICSSLITIAGSFLEIDYRLDSRSLDTLGEKYVLPLLNHTED
ncbi:octopine dehydrogenase [Erysipelotrichaceae bacterium]|nr:octopine dehydrogenase [Erysipelotrichaceae bacterium]